jgi:hypothetical protein
MRKVWTFVWIGIWLLTFAGRSPEVNPADAAQPSVIGSAMSLGSILDSSMVAGSFRDDSGQVEELSSSIHPFAESQNDSPAKIRQKSNRSRSQKHVWWAFWTSLGGIGVWQLTRSHRARMRKKRAKPHRPTMVKWLAYSLGILAILVLIGLGWFASLSILGLTFAMAGWFTLGVSASLVFCVLLGIGLFWVFENADFDWPRGFLAKVFLFILLIPLFIGIILVLSALSFFLFLNVFLVPVVGFFAAVAVMATMVSAILLSMAVWEAITESVEDQAESPQSGK